MSKNCPSPSPAPSGEPKYSEPRAWGTLVSSSLLCKFPVEAFYSEGHTVDTPRLLSKTRSEYNSAVGISDTRLDRRVRTLFSSLSHRHSTAILLDHYGLTLWFNDEAFGEDYDPRYLVVDPLYMVHTMSNFVYLSRGGKLVLNTRTVFDPKYWTIHSRAKQRAADSHGSLRYLFNRTKDPEAFRAKEIPEHLMSLYASFVGPGSLPLVKELKTPQAILDYISKEDWSDRVMSKNCNIAQNSGYDYRPPEQGFFDLAEAYVTLLHQGRLITDITYTREEMQAQWETLKLHSPEPVFSPALRKALYNFGRETSRTALDLGSGRLSRLENITQKELKKYLLAEKLPAAEMNLFEAWCCRVHDELLSRRLKQGEKPKIKIIEQQGVVSEAPMSDPAEHRLVFSEEDLVTPPAGLVPANLTAAGNVIHTVNYAELGRDHHRLTFNLQDLRAAATEMQQARIRRDADE